MRVLKNVDVLVGIEQKYCSCRILSKMMDRPFVSHMRADNI